VLKHFCWKGRKAEMQILEMYLTVSLISPEIPKENKGGMDTCSARRGRGKSEGSSKLTKGERGGEIEERAYVKGSRPPKGSTVHWKEDEREINANWL